MRAAGSSPCVAPGKPTAHEHAHDPDMGIYRASYTLGSWICIADRDSWRRNEVTSDKKYVENTERRGSTDSEKDFRKKYQAITHRLVHRKSCVEMFRRQSSNSFGELNISHGFNFHEKRILKYNLNLCGNFFFNSRPQKQIST